MFRGQVMRAAPQQLRLVSDAERTLFEVDEESRKLLHAKANEAMSRLNRVIDISDEGEPDLDELEVPPVQGGGPVEPEGPAAHGGPGERQVPAEPEGPGERHVPAEPDGHAEQEAEAQAPAEPVAAPADTQPSEDPNVANESRNSETIPMETETDKRRREREAYDPLDDVPASVKQRRKQEKLAYNPLDDVPASIKRSLEPQAAPAAEEDPSSKRPREDGGDLEMALALLTEEHDAFEVHINIPDREKESKAWRRYHRDPAAYAAASMKKGPWYFARSPQR